MVNLKKENLPLITTIVFGALILFMLITQFVIGSSNAGYVPSSPGQGIIVTGEGSVSVKPDIARVTLGVESQAAIAKDAQRKNSEVMAKIVAGLKNSGLAAKDIQTTDFSLFPVHHYDKATGQDRLVGYRAVNQVTVTVRDLVKLGEAIDGSIEAGATNVQNISFSVESPGKWRAKAIEKAVQLARSKADAMAKASGVKIKGILSVNESSINIQPYLMERFKQAADLQMAAVQNTPIEPGNIKVTANVQMSFRI